MAVLVKITNRGGSLAMYDQVAAQLVPELKRQAGFHAHFAQALDDGFAVHELWDSREQHEAWFEGNVRPKMPPGATPQVEVLELHSLATK